MRHLQRRLLMLGALLAALQLMAACAQPAHNPPLRDDTQNIDHPDRGMRESSGGTM